MQNMATPSRRDSEIASDERAHVRLGERWMLWRWACLRAPGFSARSVLELAERELPAAADRWLAIADEVATRRDEAIAHYKAAVQRGGSEGHAAEHALKVISRGAVPAAKQGAAADDPGVRFAEASARLDALMRELTEKYERARQVTSRALRDIAGNDRIRQALLWQNRSAVRTGVDWLLRRPIEAGDSATREKERLVASYVQRFCLKNDTIGFFGPVGWARFVDHPHGLVQRPGPSLLSKRTVYYEYWTIDALAQKLTQSEEMRPRIAPRLLPQFRVDGTTLHYPIARQFELPSEFAAVVARCNGLQSALQIAQEVASDAELGMTEGDVFDALDELVSKGIVQWSIEVPTAGAHPERHLRNSLEAIEDGALREGALHQLDELDTCRREVAASSNAAELETALAGFDATFSRITGADSERGHGKTYAGRTPLYEDCRRDLDVELGRAVVDRLAAPLELLLQSARWFTYEIASRYRKELTAIYDRLAAEQGSSAVDYATFWQHVPPLFPGVSSDGSIVASVRDELHRRWQGILGVDDASTGVIRRHAKDIAGAVHAQFSAPGPGWPAARYHSPDLMIAAESADAINRGDFSIVVGELHVGMNTVLGPVFFKEHPHPEELVAAHDADIDRTCIAPVWSKAISRADYYSPSPVDLDLEHGPTRSARPPSQVVRVAELVVQMRDGMLEVSTRDGQRRFDIIAFLEHHLIAESHSTFSVLARSARGTRVMIDDLVVARASWHVDAKELSWPSLKEPRDRFLHARRWARSVGLPRWLFVKTVNEVKPVYVDFDSVVYVEILAKLLRNSPSASLSEMLPAVDQIWVADAEGGRYTSELRIAAVDSEPWRPERA